MLLIIGAGLSEPHVVRLTAEMSVVYRRAFGRKINSRFNPIRALILHLAQEHLAASMRITRGSHYKDKSSR